MNPGIWIAGGIGALALYLSSFRKTALHGEMTPARQHLFQCIMGQETRPEKLDKAAGLFDREGLDDCANQLRRKAREICMQMRAIADLCERVRLGDQNAMGTLAAVREQAKAGNRRAILSCQFADWYCRTHPTAAPIGPQAPVPVSPDAAPAT